ncbi:hypothetical protein EV714DRAFT_279103 [Schizophyllum commune]
MEATEEGPARDLTQTRDVIQAQTPGAERADFVGHPTFAMQRLPTELWSNIFYFALPDSWLNASLGWRRLRYAQVCRAWRAIAFSTPRLWNRIRLHYGFDLTLAMAEIDRTGNTPLDVEVLFMFADSPGYEPAWAVWTFLCSLSHRWASVDISLGMMQAAWDILSGRDFPLLRSIYLSRANEDIDGSNAPLRHFVNAPNVSELYVVITSVSAPVLALPSPWALEHLTFHFHDYTIRTDHISPDVAWDITVACRDTLQSGSSEFARTLSPPSLSAPVTCFPALEDLELSDEGSCFALLIAAPNLVELSIEGGSGADGQMNSELQMLSRLSTLLDRSGDCPQLQYLTLIHVDLAKGDLLSCLRRVPSLVSLEIVSFFYEEAKLSVLRALIRDPGVPSSMELLPCLTKLTVCHDDWRKEYPVRQLFCAAVRSRMFPATFEGRELACIKACHTHDDHSFICRFIDGRDDDYDMTLERIGDEFDLKNYDTEKGLERRFYWVGDRFVQLLNRLIHRFRGSVAKSRCQ